MTPEEINDFVAENPELLLVDDDGSPIGFVNMDVIQTEGVKFAFALAAVCDLEDEVAKLLADTLARVGTESFGYVAASALSVMTKEILNSTLEVADAAGIYLRPGLYRIAAGKGPVGGDDA